MSMLTIKQFKTGPMFTIGVNKHYAFSREERVTYKDEYALNVLKTIDPDCLDTYLKDFSRSYYTQDFHLKSVLGYNTSEPELKVWNMSIVNQVKDDMIENMRKAGIKATSLSPRTDLDQVSYVSSSSAGYGYQGKKGEFKDKNSKNNHWKAITRAKKMALNYHDAQDKGECITDAIMNSTPYIGYTRTQLTDITEKLKVRNVWGSPFHHILLEGLAAQPMIEQFVNKNSFIHIGGDPLATVAERISQLNDKYTWLYTYDWSKFDATCSRFEIRLAFDVIKKGMNFPDKESENTFDLMKELFIYKKVVGPDGNIYSCNKGVPSGSFWTNLVDSIINYFRIQYLWLIITGNRIEDLDTHGDDGVGGSETYVSTERLTEEASKYGWILNPDKSIVTRDMSIIEFLGRSSHGGWSRRAIDKCLRLLVYTEYPVESGNISSFRAESIYNDVGRASDRLRQISSTLKRNYGVALEEEVPRHFKKPKYV
jgi:hypothetical protein